MNPRPTLLIVGSMALDTVEAPGGSVEDALGGAVTYASLACSFFARPAPICVVGEDFPEEHVALLAKHGVDTSGIQRMEGKTFRWKARYLEDYDQRETLDTQCNVFADFRPVLNEEQRKAEYVFLANIHPSLQLSVLEQTERAGIVGCDTMDLWINTEREKVEEVIASCDILLVNDSEARLLCQPPAASGPSTSLGMVSEQSNHQRPVRQAPFDYAQGKQGKPGVRRAGEELRSMGPGCVVIKRGSQGAFVHQGAAGRGQRAGGGKANHEILRYAQNDRNAAARDDEKGAGDDIGEIFLAPAYPVERVVDPTGAGDAFAGAMMGYLAREGNMEAETVRKAVILGTVLASFTVEDFSVRRLEGLTREEILRRYGELAGMTEFGKVEL